MAQQTIMNVDKCLNELFKIESSRLSKAISILTKILQKIIQFPNESRYQSINYQKINKKFEPLQCKSIMNNLLFNAGFVIDADRMKLASNKIDKVVLVLSKLNDKIKFEQEKLEIQNQTRVQTKENNQQSKYPVQFIINNDENKLTFTKFIEHIAL